jgi:hypothetical protein
MPIPGQAACQIFENSCHWVLDMTYREDDSRIRIDHGAENFSVLRRISVNLIKQRKAGNISFKGRRLKATWSTDYRSRARPDPRLIWLILASCDSPGAGRRFLCATR